MKYVPLNDYLVIQAHEPEKKVASSIRLPDSIREDKRLGEVLSIGPGRETDFGKFLEIQGMEVGQTIVFNPLNSYELDKKERLFLVRSGDINCVIDND